MHLVSELGDKVLPGAAVFFTVHWIGKPEALAVMTGFTMSVTLVGLNKLLFKDGRPYFLNPNVHPYSCEDLEFGFPSGHTCVSVATYTTFYYCLTKRIPLLKTNLFLKYLGYLVLIAAICLIGFSRFFLGVHSID